jgi:LacI family transcriptional regulator
MTPRRLARRADHEEHTARGGVTINDVARLANVSKKTVSRVINDVPYVEARTRERIEAVMRQYNYVPEAQARGLASRRSFLVGMVYDNPNPEYVVSLQEGILDGLANTGVDLVARPVDQSRRSYLGEVRAFVTRQKLMGVILFPSVSEDAELAQLLSALDCTYVRIASVVLDEAPRMVVTHDYVGGRAAGRHLVALGHQCVGHISGPAHFRSTHERLRGFVDGLAEAGVGMATGHSRRGEYTFESGLACGRDLLSERQRPTAIFAGNDEMALGVYRAARELRVRIPEDLSVVGYDDSPAAARVWPALTTVRLPVREMGRAAAQQLLAPDVTPGRNAEFEPRLLVRGSTADPGHP